METGRERIILMNKQEIKARLEYWKTVYSKLQQAYIALIDGGVQSYTIDDRNVHKLDLPDIKKQMDQAEEKIAELTALLNGLRSRKAFGIIPRDW